VEGVEVKCSPKNPYLLVESDAGLSSFEDGAYEKACGTIRSL
jgi:hypothetical protein